MLSREDHPSQSLTLFVLLAWGLTWLFSIPFVYCWRVVLDGEFAPWLLVFLPAPYGPSLAALLLARRAGPGEVRRLLSSLAIWRVGVGPWAAALLLPIATVALAVPAGGGHRSVFTGPPSLEALAGIPLILLLALPFGPLPEELGWRGWLLPRLQARFDPLASSLVLAFVWTFWHTPMFWFPGAAIPSFLDFGPGSVMLYLAQIAGEAMVMTALFNASRGSVLLAIVYHLTFNTAETTLFSLFQAPAEGELLPIYLWTIAISWATGLAGLWLTRRSTVR